MSEVTAEAAAEMSREEALRALATADGVSEQERRISRVMLEGPTITAADEQRLRVMPVRHTAASRSVAAAMHHMRVEAQAERERGL